MSFGVRGSTPWRHFHLFAAGACGSMAVMQNAVLAFVDDIYEDLELWYPKLRLEEAGLPSDWRRAR
jgi:hypothetical protein